MPTKCFACQGNRRLLHSVRPLMLMKFLCRKHQRQLARLFAEKIMEELKNETTRQ